MQSDIMYLAPNVTANAMATPDPVTNHYRLATTCLYVTLLVIPCFCWSVVADISFVNEKTFLLMLESKL